MTDITPIVLAVLALISAVLTVVIVPWIRSKTTAEQWTQIGTWVEIAVHAAEQLYSGNGRGAEKLEYVVAFLKAKKLYIDPEKIKAMIEAEVSKLNGGKKNAA